MKKRNFYEELQELTGKFFRDLYSTKIFFEDLTAKKITDNPNEGEIIKYLSRAKRKEALVPEFLFFEEGRSFRMERLRGIPLKVIINNLEVIDTYHFRQIIEKVKSSLEKLHNYGFVHSSVASTTPDLILTWKKITGWECKITSFGNAKLNPSPEEKAREFLCLKKEIETTIQESGLLFNDYKESLLKILEEVFK